MPTKAQFSGNDGQLAKPYFDGVVLVLLPTLINLPSLRELPVSRSLISLLFIALFAKNFILYAGVSQLWAKRVAEAFGELFSKKCALVWWLLLLVALYAVADIRGGYLGTTQFFSFVGFSLWSVFLLLYLYSVFALNPSREVRRTLILTAVAGLGVFVLLNLAGYAIGLRGFNSFEGVSPNKTLSMLGVSAQRVAFPFANGLNNFGTIAGLAIVTGFSVLYSSGRGWTKLLGFMVMALGLVGVVIGDSRAALVIGSICCVLIPLVCRSMWLSWGLRLLPVLVLAAPLVIVGIANIAEATTLGELVMREGNFARKLGLLTGRDAVWGAALGILNSPHPLHFVGYGSFGQYTSGAAEDYAWVFAGGAGANLHSLHNAALQVIFDVGYFGLAVWLLIWVGLSTKLADFLGSPDKSITAMFGISVVLFVLLAGIFEICGTPLFPDVFALLILLIIVAVTESSPGLLK